MTDEELEPGEVSITVAWNVFVMAAVATVGLYLVGCFAEFSGRAWLTLVGFLLVFILGVMLSGYVHRKIHLGGFGLELTIAVFGGVASLFATQLASDLNLLPGLVGQPPFSWFPDDVAMPSRARLTFAGSQIISLIAVLGAGLWLSASLDKRKGNGWRKLYSVLALVLGIAVFGSYALLIAMT